MEITDTHKPKDDITVVTNCLKVMCKHHQPEYESTQGGYRWKSRAVTKRSEWEGAEVLRC